MPYTKLLLTLSMKILFTLLKSWQYYSYFLKLLAEHNCMLCELRQDRA